MHTKGPWKLDIRVGCVAVYPADEGYKCLSGIGQSFIHYKGGTKIVTDEDEHVSWEMDEQDIANARLIAAAPELLDIWEQAIADIERTGYVSVPVVVKAEEAIHKAKSHADTLKGE